MKKLSTLSLRLGLASMLIPLATLTAQAAPNITAVGKHPRHNQSQGKNVTPEQQKLRQDMKSLRKQHGMERLVSLKNALEIFAKDKLDTQALKAIATKIKPTDEMLEKRAQLMIRRHQNMAAKPNGQQGHAKMKGFRSMEMEDTVDMVAAILELTDSQKSQVQALMPTTAEIEKIKEQHRSTRQALQQELKSNNPSTAKLVQLLKTNRDHRKMDLMLGKLEAFHAILTPAQRSHLVKVGNQRLKMMEKRLQQKK